MIDVLRISVSKERLRAMSKKDRSFLLSVGYAANQLTLITKLIVFSTNKTPSGIEQILSDAQSQMLTRLLIGTLHETWELIRKGLLRSQESKKYIDKLDHDGQDCLGRLKKHFGKSNLLGKLRDKYIFHHPHDPEALNNAFEAAANDPELDRAWNWYFSNSNFNSFYHINDIIILHGIMHETAEQNIISAHTKLMADMNVVSQDMTRLIMSITASFWLVNFGEGMDGELVERIEDAPRLFEFWLPFFVDPTTDGITETSPISQSA